MKKIKVMTIFGTRPEAIKMAPLVKELEKDDAIESIVCVTAQHRQMLDQVLKIFKIIPQYDLNIMQEKQTLAHITSRVLQGLIDIINDAKPDIVLVHGDTTTTFAGALAGFYTKTKVGHVEAGLRTYDKYSPFPEEMNRKLTGNLADIHFAPTDNNKENLLKESINQDIYVTGNTVIDALKTTVTSTYQFANQTLKEIDFNKKVIVVTAHRRENLGEPLENICNAIKQIAESHKEVEVVYPVHLNPLVLEPAKKILGGTKNVHLIEPLDVQELHNLMDRSYMIMTDSGGLQEEAPALGKPVLVLRKETERPEAVKAGTVKIAGTEKENIVKMANELLNNPEEYEKMNKAANPYGDGKASQRIVQAIKFYFGVNVEPPIEF
ncbi:MAG: UDP-N-acetylglucosamine 2-epimerase (non-hydrolyzing) [Clostridiales bacterium]|nr:UDP-N-acetylglucosamine 2-epimerase (non-hydrolyzing) [Clostridiales bacterium]